MPTKATKTPQRTDRRTVLLSAALGAVAAGAAGRLAVPQTAEAADLVLGQINNATPKATTLRSDRDGLSLKVENRGGVDTRVAILAWVGKNSAPAVQGDNAAIVARGDIGGTDFAFTRGLHAIVKGGVTSEGVRAEADAGFGVVGMSDSGTGVKAQSTSGKALEVVGPASITGSASISGAASVGAGLTVTGNGTFSGALSAAALSGDGSGITNLDAGDIAAGTLNNARLSTDVPLKSSFSNAFNGTVRALAFGGPGVNAPAFTSSGQVRIEKGRKRVTVSNIAATRSTKAVAMPLGTLGEGVYVTHIERGSGKFDIVLSESAKVAAYVAYLIFR